jgi:4-hydroxyphenylacetate 3-monooxygenase
MRTGSDYLDGLTDGREVYLDGERIADVTAHPAFAAPVRVIADIYDSVAADPASAWEDPETGERFSGMWRIPRSADDLRARRATHEQWARPSYGLMGRTPDHVASLLTAFRGSSDVFARGGTRFAENVVRFYEKARREDAYVAYTIVPPQVDRSKPAHQQPEPFLYAGAAEEREDGIVVRGAQMIGTAAAMADYLLLTYVVPLVPGDEDYAISCVMPINSPGLRVYPRRPYSTIATTEFDYPLSSHFDEIDSMVVFDDVFVPWEHVFVYRDVALCRDQFTQTGAHLMANFQALSRFGVKVRFAAGLAKRLTELHGIDKVPPVQGQLGHGVATIGSQLEALVLAAEARPSMREGMAIPDRQFVYTGMSLQRQLAVDLMKWLRELAGGAYIAVPSSEESFDAPETAEHTRRYYRSVTASAEERVQLLKLMWDFVGTEFAGRQLQYEMFYSAAQHVADARIYHAYPWEAGRTLVDDALARTARHRVAARSGASA